EPRLAAMGFGERFAEFPFDVLDHVEQLLPGTQALLLGLAEEAMLADQAPPLLYLSIAAPPNRAHGAARAYASLGDHPKESRHEAHFRGIAHGCFLCGGVAHHHVET